MADESAPMDGVEAPGQEEAKDNGATKVNGNSTPAAPADGPVNMVRGPYYAYLNFKKSLYLTFCHVESLYEYMLSGEGSRKGGIHTHAEPMRCFLPWPELRMACY
jgi:hypothetical protein